MEQVPARLNKFYHTFKYESSRQFLLEICALISIKEAQYSGSDIETFEELPATLMRNSPSGSSGFRFNFVGS